MVCCNIFTEKLKSSLREKKINVDDFQVESNPLLHYQPNLKVNYGVIDKVMLNIQLFASKSHMTHRTRDGYTNTHHHWLIMQQPFDPQLLLERTFLMDRSIKENFSSNSALSYHDPMKVNTKIRDKRMTTRVSERYRFYHWRQKWKHVATYKPDMQVINRMVIPS